MMKRMTTVLAASALIFCGSTAFAGDGGFLTTHVLDTYTGLPAEGVRIDFLVKEGDGYKLVKTLTTNKDGRTDAPVMGKDVFETGSYELIFYVGDYYAKIGAKVANPAFLDKVPVMFSMADGKAHYHVPLTVTPWSYSTYRGS